MKTIIDNIARKSKQRQMLRILSGEEGEFITPGRLADRVRVAVDDVAPALRRHGELRAQRRTVQARSRRLLRGTFAG